MDYVQPLKRNWTSVCLLSLACVMSSGCAKLYHAVHYNPLSLAMHDHAKNYYHSDKTGRIIAKDRCYIPEEPPCYGYEPTCWTRWPADCPKCPVDCQAESGEVIIHEQLIATPADSIIVEQPQPEELDGGTAEPIEEPAADDPSSQIEPDYDESASAEIPAADLPKLEFESSIEKADILPRELANMESLAAENEEPVDAAQLAEKTISPEIQELPLPRKIDVKPHLVRPQGIQSVEKTSPQPAPSADRHSSRRKRTLAVTLPAKGNTAAASQSARSAKMNAEVGQEFADFEMLATASWVAQLDHSSPPIPSFRIPVKQDSHVSVASEARKLHVERHTTKPALNVSTVSFR